jgi:hypothetical protein
MNFLRILSRDREQPKSQAEVIKRINDDLGTMITRGRFMGEKLSFGPNFVHTFITRGESGEFGKPGMIEDLGWNHNIKTTVGMDWLHNSMGGVAKPTTNSPATAITATQVTGTGSTLSANALTGYRIVMPVTGLTTKPVYANIAGNTTSIIYVDAWQDETQTTSTTPGSTSAFIVLPGTGPASYIGLTADTGTPAVGDTSLTGEITTNGCGRALATYAHTGGTTTYTLTKTFSASGTVNAIHKAGLFTSGYNTSASGGGILVADTNLNADATLASGDSLQVTWTWTLPAAG